ncbi:MAG TPA: glucose-6-phosphate dehydrogenase assembly protein OpcA [Acidimicrobiales bacterium]|nr:glucose-6-phosphate dehydrogenase assembly protein OpcA [Acidimicrobiales bacterium]
MAQPVTTTLSVWSEDGVRLGQVMRALEDLRRPEVMPATRTSVLTLVIVASRRVSAVRAQSAVRELGGRHPARVLTLVLDEPAREGAPGIDAEIRLLGSEAEGHGLWFEDIELDVHGRVVRHLDSLIEPLTLSDLPVVVWFVDELPALDDPLLLAADVLLVDARELDDAGALAELVSLCGRRPVVDLSWTRLRPWRELLAGLFEGPAFRPFVSQVRRSAVAGRIGPRQLLDGWLADRLELPTSARHVVDADHVSMHLWCDGASFSVVREGDVRRVVARAEIEGGASAAAVVQLPEATPAWGLADALARLELDPVYERALRRAVAP